jgi:uncharacterized protein with HEPN domain
MRPEDRDAAYLWDMLDAARAISEFTAGIDFAEYEKDRMRQLAVERCIEITGEAARRVSAAVKDKRPDIPWRSIIGARNILAHEYADVSLDLIWVLVTRDIPALVSTLEKLVPPAPAE